MLYLLIVQRLLRFTCYSAEKRFIWYSADFNALPVIVQRLLRFTCYSAETLTIYLL